MRRIGVRMMDDREPRDFRCGWCGRCWRTTDYLTVIQDNTSYVKARCPECGESARVYEIVREEMSWWPDITPR